MRNQLAAIALLSACGGDAFDAELGDAATQLVSDAAQADAAQGDAQAPQDGGLPVGSDASASSDYCLAKQSCSHVSTTQPASVSLLDKDSLRTEVGYQCTKDGSLYWKRTQLCDYSETCKPFAAPNGGAACVSCGELGRNRASRRIDGLLVEDCQGCLCGAWRVSACSTDLAYGEPFVVVDFQRNYDGRRYTITQSGRVVHTSGPSSPTLSNVQMAIRRGGLVEFDIAVDEQVVDNYLVKHRWQMSAHVVHICE